MEAKSGMLSRHYEEVKTYAQVFAQQMERSTRQKNQWHVSGIDEPEWLLARRAPDSVNRLVSA